MIGQPSETNYSHNLMQHVEQGLTDLSTHLLSRYFQNSTEMENGWSFLQTTKKKRSKSSLTSSSAFTTQNTANIFSYLVKLLEYCKVK